MSFDRRRFLAGSAAASVTLFAQEPERLGTGVIGTGNRGSYLLRGVLERSTRLFEPVLMLFIGLAPIGNLIAGAACNNPTTTPAGCSNYFLTTVNGTNPANNRPGIGRNVFRGPGYIQTDVSMSKRFMITEKVSVQLKLDAYNAINRVNLLEPVSDLNNNNFGKSVDQLNPKALQAYIRLMF